MMLFIILCLFSRTFTVCNLRDFYSYFFYNLAAIFDNTLAFSVSYTFFIVSLYEFLDLISIYRKIKEHLFVKMIIGLISLMLGMVALAFGYWIIKTEFHQNLAKSIGGNLIGYAEVFIIVAPMKFSFKKWMEREKFQETTWYDACQSWCEMKDCCRRCQKKEKNETLQEDLLKKSEFNA